MKDDLLRLIDQSLWANRIWIEFVHALGNSDPRAHELLAHIVLGEHVWLNRVVGEKPVTAHGTLPRAELLRGLDESHALMRRLIATRLDDDVDYTRASGDHYHASVADIIQHLITHGYHHRGQLAALYARKGVSYPNTDHIHYLMVNGL